MESFQTIKKNFAILGFCPNQNSFIALIHQHWIYFLKFAVGITSLFINLIYVTESINEIMYSMYMITAAFFVFVAFASTISKTSVLFDFFDYAETAFSMSKKDIS